MSIFRRKWDQKTYWLVVARDTDQNGIPRCIRCGSRADDVHEVLPKSSFGKHDDDILFSIENRCCLCRGCHEAVHNDFGRGQLLYIMHIRYGYIYEGVTRCLLEEFVGGQ